MAKIKNKRKRTPKSVLKLPDLEQSKSAVLNSLTSPSSQRTYDHAIREFIEWHCSEPRLAFNKTVVTRYRISLEQRRYAPTTINLRLAAVRRLAYEAADCGLLSADLAAGIRRVKGAKMQGLRGARAGEFTEKQYDVIDAVGKIAAECETSSSTVALAWLKAQSGVSSTIIGASTLEATGRESQGA